MNSSLALAKASEVYAYMKRGTAGLVRETANEVDHDPASWGLDIDDWDWNAGVGLVAISDYYERTHKAEVLDYLSGWVAKNKHQCAKKDHVNYLAPLAIYPDMFLRTNDPYYRDIAVDYADWVLASAGRSKEGVFFHGHSVSDEVWADTVFMALVFLSRTARLTANKAMAREVYFQLLSHLQLLQDEKTGVLYHGWHCVHKNFMSGALWTRGNSWIVIGAPFIMEAIGALVPMPDEILKRYRKLVDGLLSFQAENGLWHTVMTRPDFYQETSGSAGIAGGILKAVRLQMLDSGYQAKAFKAMEGVVAQIDGEGAVQGVSGGTPIMPTIDAYGKLTRYPTLYGQGLTLMMLCEYLHGQQAA
ncbi:MAG TPA: glycoside hydrolase family 88 protein [bacterium]|mgnify:CR=1 FL=1|nr:glycoside hydrolase family 88 protein [bacterium]